MSIRGAKPKPTAIHILNGNPGKRDLSKRINLENAVEKIKDDIVPVPEWLREDKIASKEWNRIVPMLSKIRLITKNDFIGLEAYCKSYSRYREAEEQMDKLRTTYFKTPQGYVQQLPQVAIAQKYLKLCKDFMVEYGLTPSSRGRMELPSEVTETDSMEELLRGS